MIIAFHKPYGVLSQFTAEQAGDRTLAEFRLPKKVYPVGRLDRDSEGLLLLSDDKKWNHLLLNPRYAHDRTYHVQIEGLATQASVEMLEKGVMIRGYRTRPCRARLLSPTSYPPRDPPVRFRRLIPTSWIELILTEGKNRQVRRMTAAVGLPTLRLIRVAVGGLKLGSLGPGQWRKINPKQLRLK